MHEAAPTIIQKSRINILRCLFVLILPLLVIAQPAYSEHSVWAEVLEPLGALTVIAGVLGRFWSILYIGGRKNQMVMMEGPYSVCRHPLYLFSTIATTGLGLMLGSIVLALVLGGLTFLVLMLTAQKEEAFLRAKFGAVYENYAAKTPLILPSLALFHTPDEVSFSVRHLRGNTFDALVFLSFIPLAESIEYIREIANLPTLYLL